MNQWCINNSLLHSDAIWQQEGSRSWLDAWWHQAIAWTNVDLSSLRSNDVHLRAISLEISQPSVNKMTLKIVFRLFYWILPGANELMPTGLWSKFRWNFKQNTNIFIQENTVEMIYEMSTIFRLQYVDQWVRWLEAFITKAPNGFGKKPTILCQSKRFITNPLKFDYS